MINLGWTIPAAKGAGSRCAALALLLFCLLLLLSALLLPACMCVCLRQCVEQAHALLTGWAVACGRPDGCVGFLSGFGA